jgi:hypothetical protein
MIVKGDFVDVGVLAITFVLAQYTKIPSIILFSLALLAGIILF